MKHLVPTLAVLACAAIPAMGAEDFTLKLSGVIQARALLGNYATNENGDNYDPLRQQNGNAEYARFGIRRARIAASAKTSDGWFGNMTIRAGEPNNLDGNYDSNGGTRGMDLYYAYVGRTFKTGDLEHDLTLGLDKAFNGESSISSSTLMFPSNSVTSTIADSQGARSAGFFYKLNHEFVRFGASVQNNTSTADGATTATNGDDAIKTGGNNGDSQNGLRFSTRIEGGLLPAKKAESFAGVPGTHVVVGFDAAKNQSVYTKDTSRADYTILGPDLMVHLDGLSFLAEYRFRSTDTTAINVNPANTTRDEARFWAVTAGYAIPTESGVVFEPAIRAQWADIHSHKGTPAATDIGNKPAITKNGEFNGDNSGRDIAVGLNTYWNGHKNKTQVAFSQAKADTEDASARFFTVQHQVLF